jgi:PadR family transcriptional regulator PadR
MNTQFKKGALELCVLSQLVGGDKYGYELTERISVEMSIAGGTLYPILRKLKEEEYVTTYLVESESGPARKYYRLTDRGRAYQIQLKQEWVEFGAAVTRLIGE